MIFTEDTVDQIYEEIKKVNGNPLSHTVSLCHTSFFHIPAVRYEKDGHVYICKNSPYNGITHHMIERSYEFYSSLVCSKELLDFDVIMLTEVTDRCNLTCPHCYHLPDNKIQDPEIEEIIERIRPSYNAGMRTLFLSGAEATLRKDFDILISSLIEAYPDMFVRVITNGIKFADYDFTKKSIDAGLNGICLGLNHPQYIGVDTVREKQLECIENAQSLNKLHYVGYTMETMSELEDILEEIFANDWDVHHFRIRYGSEIGRNSSLTRMFVSDIYDIVERWASERGMSFKVLPLDNNIYHVMVEVDGKILRLIQWCDITDIDMEELRSGPWCDFVPQDGVTNFLHQIIRRDVWKNQGNILPDDVPARYQFPTFKEYDDLDLYDITTLGISQVPHKNDLGRIPIRIV